MALPDTDAAVGGLVDYVDASPSPFHVVADGRGPASRPRGSPSVREADAVARRAGPLLRRPGRLARRLGNRRRPRRPALAFRIVGAHTDTPNLRVKPHPDAGRAGWQLVGVEVYGGALLNSWLDRDLGLSGRVVGARRTAARRPASSVVDRPLLRVPQLAIHLDREIDDHGLTLNPQQHLAAVWGLGDPRPGAFAGFVAGELGVGHRRRPRRGT